MKQPEKEPVPPQTIDPFACEVEGVLLVDLEGGRIHGADLAAARWLGRDVEQLVGVELGEFLAAEDADPIRAGLERIAEGSRCFELTVELTGIRGAQVPTRICGHPLHLIDRELVIVRLHDGAEPRVPSEELEASRQRLALHVERTPLGVIEWDLDFRVLAWNPGAERIFGFTEREAFGRHAAELILPESAREHVDRIWRELRSRSGGLRSTNENIAKDGRLLQCEWYNTSLVDSAGRVLGVASLVHDITERKLMEEQLVRAQRMEAVGRLAGGIAHDFSNILTAIQGNAELLTLDLGEGTAEARHAHEIIKGTNRAAELTRQLLAFARKSPRERRVVDVHQAIGETFTMLSHTIDRKVEVLLDLLADTPTVLGDSTQIENALLNLGVNARDAMPDGGTLTYATRNVDSTEEAGLGGLPAPEGLLEIRVTDTGSGMDAETEARVFEPFFTTKEVGKGTGLGMASVYGCVRSHGGRIEVTSDLGRGTAFVILLPCVQREADPVGPEAHDLAVPGTGHILVVDDEESVRHCVATALKGLGYTVWTCEDGLEAIDYFSEHHGDVDLVILDLIMPRMGGHETFEALRKIEPETRVIILSGYGDTRATDEMLEQGALALLGKPFEIANLSRAVAQHVRRPVK